MEDAAPTQDEPRWLDDEEMQAWLGLIDLSRELQASLGAELEQEFGLSETDYGVLVVLSEAPDERVRMCDLAARLHLTPGGLTRRFDSLVRKGLVERVPDEADRRVVLGSLTAEGRATIERAAPLHVDGVRRLFLDHLTRAQIRTLGTTLEAISRQRREGREPEGPAVGEH
jgi:DNA-binding MarR family transcriptional regulator